MLNAIKFKEILANIEYARSGREKWTVTIKYSGVRPYLQVESVGGADSETGKSLDWRGRKWWLSPYMCVTEVVRTAFKALQAAEEHELCEHFKYKKAAIFSPHRNVDLLAWISFEEGAVDTREERTSSV